MTKSSVIFVFIIIGIVYGPGAVMNGLYRMKSLTAATMEDNRKSLAKSQANSGPFCSGKNLLPEIKQNDPERYARLMAFAEAMPNGDAMFWRIERRGVAPSYLFGTIHVSDARVTTLARHVRHALASSKTLAVEIAELSKVRASPPNFSKYGVFTDGRRLHQFLSAEDYATLQTELKKRGMPPKVIPYLKPWLANMVISVPQCICALTNLGIQVLDAQLETQAKMYGLDVVGLETAELQYKALSSVPLSEQVAGLRVGLKHLDMGEDLLETTLQLYVKRKIPATFSLQADLVQRAGFSPEVLHGSMNEIIHKRNYGMRDKLLPLLNKGATFVAVGAAHLPGNTGLVTLLRNEGYTVTAIN